MRVLLDDGMQISRGTGIGKYSEYLYRTLKSAGISVDLERFDKKNGRQATGRIKYLKHINSSEYYEKSKQYDVIHHTNYSIPFRRHKQAKYVVTVHDLVAFLHPDTLSKAYGYYNRFMVRYIMKHADTVLTISESVKREIAELFPRYAYKVHVAHLGLFTEYSHQEKIRALKSKELEISLDSAPFFLFVGTIEERKNIGMIIDGFIRLKEKGDAKDIKLVLAGRPGLGYEGFLEKVRQAKLEDQVIFTGYIASEDCVWLYQNAAAYIFPSVYEGFGAPQLECMANNLPLILSDIPTNREISEGYGLFFSLADVDGLVAQMQKVVDGDIDTEQMEKVAKKQLEHFRWETLVHDYIAGYQR